MSLTLTTIKSKDSNTSLELIVQAFLKMDFKH
jgi:hypothetical protein